MIVDYFLSLSFISPCNRPSKHSLTELLPYHSQESLISLQTASLNFPQCPGTTSTCPTMQFNWARGKSTSVKSFNRPANINNKMRSMVKLRCCLHFITLMLQDKTGKKGTILVKLCTCFILVNNWLVKYSRRNTFGPLLFLGHYFGTKYIFCCVQAKLSSKWLLLCQNILLMN